VVLLLRALLIAVWFLYPGVLADLYAAELDPAAFETRIFHACLITKLDPIVHPKVLSLENDRIGRLRREASQK
jgi:hypothetical protein